MVDDEICSFSTLKAFVSENEITLLCIFTWQFVQANGKLLRVGTNLTVPA